jgi:hypothetical protein
MILILLSYLSYFELWKKDKNSFVLFNKSISLQKNEFGEKYSSGGCSCYFHYFVKKKPLPFIIISVVAVVVVVIVLLLLMFLV